MPDEVLFFPILSATEYSKRTMSVPGGVMQICCDWSDGG